MFRGCRARTELVKVNSDTYKLRTDLFIHSKGQGEEGYVVLVGCYLLCALQSLGLERRKKTNSVGGTAGNNENKELVYQV